MHKNWPEIRVDGTGKAGKKREGGKNIDKAGKKAKRVGEKIKTGQKLKGMYLFSLYACFAFFCLFKIDAEQVGRSRRDRGGSSGAEREHSVSLLQWPVRPHLQPCEFYVHFVAGCVALS